MSDNVFKINRTTPVKAIKLSYTDETIALINQLRTKCACFTPGAKAHIIDLAVRQGVQSMLEQLDHAYPVFDDFDSVKDGDHDE